MLSKKTWPPAVRADIRSDATMLSSCGELQSSGLGVRFPCRICYHVCMPIWYNCIHHCHSEPARRLSLLLHCLLYQNRAHDIPSELLSYFCKTKQNVSPSQGRGGPYREIHLLSTQLKSVVKQCQTVTKLSTAAVWDHAWQWRREPSWGVLVQHEAVRWRRTLF